MDFFLKTDSLSASPVGCTSLRESFGYTEDATKILPGAATPGELHLHFTLTFYIYIARR